MKAAEYRKLNNPLADKDWIIGIDAGVHTGFAVFARKPIDYRWHFETLTFWGAYDRLKSVSGDISQIGVVIEVPNSRRVMYMRVDGNSDAGRVRESMAARIGSNRREAELLAERIESLGYTVIRVTPTKTKWNAKELERHTGIKTRTNEHVRDAIRLAWNHI